MSYNSVTLVTLDKEGNEVKVPVISPESIEDCVMGLFKNKVWNIVSVTDNSGTFNHRVLNGVIQDD